MESLIKQTLISFLLVSALMFGIVYLVHMDSKRKDTLQKELADQIYHSQNIHIISCNFTSRYNNQTIRILSLSPLKIQADHTVYLYPGVWSMEYDTNQVVLRNGSWVCQGIAQ